MKISWVDSIRKHSKKHDKEMKLLHERIFECPYCEQIITLKYTINEQYIIPCPGCGHHGIIINEKERKKNNMNEQLPSPPWFHQPYLRAKIVGLIFILIGFIFLINPSMLNLKISITLFFIGGLLFILISEKKFIINELKKPKKTSSVIQNLMNRSKIIYRRNKLVISEKITLIIIIATLFLFLVTNPADLEIFLVLVYLSLLIIKELIDEFTPVHVKKRLNYVIVVFFVIFAVIIIERIITILDI